MNKFLREAKIGILEALTALYYYCSEVMLLSSDPTYSNTQYFDAERAIKLLQDAREIVKILCSREEKTNNEKDN